ncbi:MAG: uroporphyrinogen decarboxylase family protein [Candidatus Marinimicrobia bacterium]|nr:uroporphyrinogen decarboxylase family protein [Candidatus Neomarinimicrobiota bacterium]
MKPKEILEAALRGEATPRPAWVPFVGVHGGKLIGCGASEYLQSAEKLIAGQSKAIELYRPDGIPVVFDLQLEAEVLGCTLHWAEAVPPSVTSHPLLTQDLAALPRLDETKGRYPLVTRALDELVAAHGDEVAFYGLVCGPFTLALHLLGHDIFLEMFDNPERIQDILAFAAETACAAAKIFSDHGAKVIAVVDPMTSQISPEHFTEFVTPAVNRVFDYIRNDLKRFSSIFVCGDANRNLDLLVGTHADNVSVDEQIPIPRLRELAEAQGKSFGGNIRLTSVLLLGDERDAKLEALGLLEQGGARGFILAPGCDLPYDTPPANLQAVAEMVHDEYAREVARTTLKAREADEFADITVPDYDAAQAVVLDVITLDSSSCAPCQYMMEAVEKAAAAAAPLHVWVNEHKIKVREGIGMMTKLGVKNLPTICIDGDVKFASLTPDHKTLVQAIRDRAREKGLL